MNDIMHRHNDMTTEYDASRFDYEAAMMHLTQNTRLEENEMRKSIEEIIYDAGLFGKLFMTNNRDEYCYFMSQIESLLTTGGYDEEQPLLFEIVQPYGFIHAMVRVIGHKSNIKPMTEKVVYSESACRPEEEGWCNEKAACEMHEFTCGRTKTKRFFIWCTCAEMVSILDLNLAEWKIR